jgi:hypothetical protein
MTKKMYFLSVLAGVILLSTPNCFSDVPQSPANDESLKIPPIMNQKNNTNIKNQLEAGSIANISFSDSLGVKDSDFKILLQSRTAHLAFTDIIKFNNVWYITFRFSDGHLPKNFANIIIYKSTDLKVWQMEQIFTQEGYDLRDPKFYIHNNNLYVQFHSTTINPYAAIRNDYISMYNASKSIWEKSVMLNKNEDLKSWFWRISSINNKLIVGGYYTVNRSLSLFESNDGINYNKINNFDLPDQPGESTIRMKDSTIYIFVRDNLKEAKLGIGNLKDITHWEFTTLPMSRIGGPNFVLYKDFLLLGCRLNAKTVLQKYDLNSKKLTPLGETQKVKYDSGYPGMYIENNLLYFTYYTSSEDNEFQINLSIIDLDKVL